MRESIEVAGRTRTFTVAGTPSKDLVLVFHGSKQTGDKHRDFTGHAFDTLGVVAYLDGYRKQWNDARRQSSFAARTENVDDVGFARAVIDRLTAGHGIDPGRVFAVGYSNGGQMVMRLMHEAPELLAGAAIIGATMPAPDDFLMPHPTPAPKPMPVLLIHGTKDPIVPYEGGPTKWWVRTLFKVGGESLSAPATAAYFARRNGITTDPVTTKVAPAVERTAHDQAGRPPVVLHTIHGGGHTIPGPRRNPAMLGRTNQDISAADLIADLLR